MEEKELKTSPKQRFFIILIAVFMVGSIVASYAAIVISGSQGASTGVDETKVAQYAEAYSEAQAEFTEATQADFDKFIEHKSEVTAYNETSANEGGLQTKDVVKGTGEKLADGDTDYLAYYVGWCADETVFDSSYNDSTNPTGFSKILDASLGMIEGWNAGVVGMRPDGIRVITIPGELAYGESREICGGYNKPLKFMVMVKEKTAEMTALSEKLEDAMMRYQYALYGIDYDSVKANSE